MTVCTGCIYKSHVHSILSVINEREEAKCSDLREISTSWKTLDSRLKWMVDKGLLDVREREHGRRIKMYTLTDDGRRVLYLMDLGESCIEGEFDFSEAKVIEKVDIVLGIGKK